MVGMDSVSGWESIRALILLQMELFTSGQHLRCLLDLLLFRGAMTGAGSGSPNEALTLEKPGRNIRRVINGCRL